MWNDNGDCAHTFIDAQALNLLTSLLTSSRPFGPENPAFLPPPQHLSLISTLIVHPSLTTRAKSPEQLQISILALKYLRLVYHSVGPLNARLCDAFIFSSPGKTRRGVSRRKSNSESESPFAEDANRINSELASTDALWTKGDDFWHILGWAFNCSVVHQRRWKKWQVWLDLMMSILENDWDQRDLDQKRQSLIITYVNASDGVHAGEKRILRAVFADGSTRSLQEFREIWKNETKERKPRSNDVSETQNVISKTNIEEGNYGDYLSSESEADDEDPAITEHSPLTPSPSDNTTLPDGSLILGGSEALNFRLRMLSLLSNVATFLPENFTSIPTLYDMYLVYIRPLPVPTFALVMSPLGLEIFAPAAASSLTQCVLRSLVSTTAPLPERDYLTQEVLEKCYLPWPANTISIADNIKVSLCVETLFRLFDNMVGIKWSKGLVDAVEKGIEARDGKARKEGKRKGETGGGGIESDRHWLNASAERMRGVVYMAETANET